MIWGEAQGSGNTGDIVRRFTCNKYSIEETYSHLNVVDDGSRAQTRQKSERVKPFARAGEGDITKTTQTRRGGHFETGVPSMRQQPV